MRESRGKLILEYYVITFREGREVRRYPKEFSSLPRVESSYEEGIAVFGRLTYIAPAGTELFMYSRKMWSLRGIEYNEAPELLLYEYVTGHSEEREERND